jgi:hypothetical protein
MAEEPTPPAPTSQLPPPTFFDAIGQFFSRRDKLIEYIAVTDRQIVDMLAAWLTAQGIPIPPNVTVTIPPAVPPTPPVVPGFPPELRVIPRPTGSIAKQGSLAAPTTTYATVVDYTPTKDKRFQIAKIAVSCSEDIIVQLTWRGKEVTIPYYIMAKLPFTDWFPLDYSLVTNDEFFKGDGDKKLELKAKIPSGGTAAQVDGEIVGEEV